MRFFAAFLALASLLASAPASAQIVRGEDKTVYSKRTVIDISGVEIKGELLSPPTCVLPVRGGSRFASMIRLRAHFMPELNASTDKL